MLLQVILLAAFLLSASSDRIGGIEFFGYKGLDLAAIRAGLPVHVGDEIRDDTGARIRSYVHTTDVNFVCCDTKGEAWIYIGLGGETITYLPKPSGSLRLSPELNRLHSALEKAAEAAVMKGGEAAQEDQSEGYALSKDPAARGLQLKLREYALQHKDELLRVLAESAANGQRAIAAEALGYASRSPDQIAALVRAARDSDGTVRNNATRALWVLASSGPAVAAQIDPGPFIEMVRSGRWTDRNKASLVLAALADTGDTQVLRAIGEQGRDSLMEMAAWHNEGHAEAARDILERLERH